MLYETISTPLFASISDLTYLFNKGSYITQKIKILYFDINKLCLIQMFSEGRKLSYLHFMYRQTAFNLSEISWRTSFLFILVDLDTCIGRYEIAENKCRYDSTYSSPKQLLQLVSDNIFNLTLLKVKSSLDLFQLNSEIKDLKTKC